MSKRDKSEERNADSGYGREQSSSKREPTGWAQPSPTVSPSPVQSPANVWTNAPVRTASVEDRWAGHNVNADGTPVSISDSAHGDYDAGWSPAAVPAVPDGAPAGSVQVRPPETVTVVPEAPPVAQRPKRTISSQLTNIQAPNIKDAPDRKTSTPEPAKSPKQVRDKTVVCKARPKDNRPKPGGGSGKRFVPWKGTKFGC